MKKIIFLMLLAGLIALGISSFTTVSINPILKKTVHYIGPKVMGSDVQLEDAKLSTLSGYGTLHNIYIANPYGFPKGHCIQIGTIDVEMQPSSIGTGTIVINNLTIKAMDVAFIINRKINNYGTMLRHLRRRIPEAPSYPPNPNSQIDYEKVIGNKYIIKNVHIITPSVSGSLPRPQEANFSIIMDDMHIKDVGLAENGIPFLKALDQILTKVEARVHRTVLETYVNYKDE